MTGARKKVATVDYSVADAISVGTSQLTDLRDELQNWLDNMPESLQQGSKANELQEAIDALDNVDSYSAHEALESTEELEGDLVLGGLRLQYTESQRRRQSRADRCSEACGLLRLAEETVRGRLDELRKESEDDDVTTNAIEDVESNLDELAEMIDNAEGVSWPGAR